LPNNVLPNNDVSSKATGVRQNIAYVVLGKTSLGKTLLGETLIGKTLLGKTSLGKTSLGKMSLGETLLGKTSLGKTSLGKMSLGETSLGKTPLGKTSLGKTLLGKWTPYLAVQWFICYQNAQRRVLINSDSLKSPIDVRLQMHLRTKHLKSVQSSQGVIAFFSQRYFLAGSV
jgi:hypothetical protein